MSKVFFVFALSLLFLVVLNHRCLAEETSVGEKPPQEMTLIDEKTAFYVGQKAFVERYYDVAARSLSSFVKAFPASENLREAYLLLGQSYFYLKQYDDALASFQSAAATKGSESVSETISFWSARCDLARGLPDRALEVFTAFAQKPSASQYYLHSLYNISLCYEAKAEYKKAIEQLDVVRKADPEGKLTLPCALHEARCLVGLQRPSDAQKLLLPSIEKNPNDPQADEAFFLLGEITMSLQDYESSLKYYEKSVRGDRPEEWYPQAYYGMGWCHLKLKRYEDALKVFENIRQLHPTPDLAKNVDLSICRLRLLRQENDLAMAALNEYLGRYPGDPTVAEANCLIAQAHLNMKDFKAAVQQYDKVISAFPDTPLLDRAYFGKGEALYGSGNYVESAQAFRKVSEISKDSELRPEAVRRTAEALYAASDYDGAITAYREILEKMPPSAKPDEILFRLGWSYYRKADYDSAIASFGTLLTKFPASEHADNSLYRLGGAYCRKGEYDKALIEYEKLEKNYPKSDLLDRVKYQIGVSNYNTGKYYPALVAFGEVVEKFPQSPLNERCSYEIGWCHHQLGKQDDALKHFRAHIAKYGKTELSGEALFWIGEYNYNQGKYDLALENFQQLAREYPTHKLADRALYWKGRCAFDLTKHKDAAAAFSEVVERFPKSDLAMDSLYQLGCAYKEQKMFAEAVVAFEKVNELYPRSYLKDDLTYQIADCLLSMGRRTEALSAYTGLLHSDNPATRARGRYGRGKCFQDFGMYSAAIAELMDVIWEFPEEKDLASDSAFAAAACYQALGRRQDAIRVYSLIVDGNLKDKDKAEKAIESLRKESLFFLTK